MALLVYRCPNCGASHEIEESLVGDRVTCRQCGRPFEAAAPVAKPVEIAEGEKASFRVTAGEGEIENTILEAHPSMVRKHPFRFLGILVAIVAGLSLVVIGLAGAAVIPGNPPATVLIVAGAILAGAGGLAWAYWWAQSRFTTLTITNRRTTLRRGLFSRDTSEVRHRDVRNLQVSQTTVERLLGVGDLAISSAGQDDLEIAVQGIPNPTRVADLIRDMQ